MSSIEKKDDVSIWLPLYIGDMLAMTTRLSTEQVGALILLMMDYWKNGAIPNDLKIVGAITGLTPTKTKAFLRLITIADIFTEENNMLFSVYLDGKKTEATDNKKTKSERAVKAANARWGKTEDKSSIDLAQDKHNSSNANAMLEHTTSNANAMLEQCPLSSPSPSNNLNNTHAAGELKNSDSVIKPTFDIKSWQAPDYETMLEILVDNDVRPKLSEQDYLNEIEKFKGYNTNRDLSDEAYRFGKFIDWFRILADKQSVSQATQLASYSDENDDLPAIYRQPTSQNTGYHPSHSKPVTAKIDPACSVMFNGLLKPLLPNMDKKQTYDYVMARQDAGESSDETYDRIADEFFRGAA